MSVAVVIERSVGRIVRVESVVQLPGIVHAVAVGIGQHGVGGRGRRVRAVQALVHVAGAVPSVFVVPPSAGSSGSNPYLFSQTSDIPSLSSSVSSESTIPSPSVSGSLTFTVILAADPQSGLVAMPVQAKTCKRRTRRSAR